MTPHIKAVTQKARILFIFYFVQITDPIQKKIFAKIKTIKMKFF